MESTHSLWKASALSRSSPRDDRFSSNLTAEAIHASNEREERLESKPIRSSKQHLSEPRHRTRRGPSNTAKTIDVDELLDENHTAQRSRIEVRALTRVQQDHSNVKKIMVSPQLLPRSQHAGFEMPLPLSDEADAIQELKQECERQKREIRKTTPPSLAAESSGEDFVEFHLSDFSVYLKDNPHNSFELRPLSHLWSDTKSPHFLFDGILSCGLVKQYVQAVPFKICSIGNYGVEDHGVGDSIWIQSVLNTKEDIFYRLKRPAPEYQRFHQDFMWLANLAKHFVDFCEEFDPKTVSIFHFHSDFSRWIKRRHNLSQDFRNWRRQYPRKDFRQAVTANIRFLHGQADGLSAELMSHPIWAETFYRNFVEKQRMVESKTVVTPYVYECFEHLKFAHHLKSIALSIASETQQAKYGQALNLTTNSNPRRFFVEIPSVKIQGIEETRSLKEKLEHEERMKNIKVGDVLSVIKDEEGSIWKDEMSQWKAFDNCWYVYVQGVHEDGDKRSFDALWLYKPSDTCCAKMKYPWSNELFLSNNCTCEHSRISEDEVLDVVSIASTSQPPSSTRQLFVRQAFIDNEAFVTIKEAHKFCEHLSIGRNADALSSFSSRYEIGQTVLVLPSARKHEVEPYEVVQYRMEHDEPVVFLRRLKKRRDVDGNGRPNELVYTDIIEKFAPKAIKHKCLVRFYTEGDVLNGAVPAPYNRDGTGNAFYITMRCIHTRDGYKLKPITPDVPKTLIQGFDPSTVPSRKRLRGMDLYCGGGNFGRGLEEGGAVHNEWAVDINEAAIHTYYANLKTPTDTKLFFGSVNDLLAQAIAGNPKNNPLIPAPGEVEFISAGSPCQGFSRLNQHKKNDEALLNQSLIASVAAYVDFFRPKYGILENVMNMAQKGRGRDEDVLSQLICSIVGMGYQLQLFVVDAWSCGSPQARSRLFVSFAAPGLELPEHPPLSHSHPPQTGDRGLGQLANGESFGRRLHDPTPFKYITAGQACSDLPGLGEAPTYHCIPHPYHIFSQGITREIRLQIETIPLRPYGMNFWRSWNGGDGVMSKEERNRFPFNAKNGKMRECVLPGSRAWGRVDPTSLFPTIVRGPVCGNSRNGACLHWDEHRYITTAEAARAQGFLDGEVFIGLSREHLEIVGNSVARTVALSLGLSLRDAWLRNSDESMSVQQVSIEPVLRDLKSGGDRRRTLEIPDSEDEVLGSGVRSESTHISGVHSNKADPQDATHELDEQSDESSDELIARQLLGDLLQSHRNPDPERSPRLVDRQSPQSAILGTLKLQEEHDLKKNARRRRASVSMPPTNNSVKKRRVNKQSATGDIKRDPGPITIVTTRNLDPALNDEKRLSNPYLQRHYNTEKRERRWYMNINNRESTRTINGTFSRGLRTSTRPSFRRSWDMTQNCGTVSSAPGPNHSIKKSEAPYTTDGRHNLPLTRDSAMLSSVTIRTTSQHGLSNKR